MDDRYPKALIKTVAIQFQFIIGSSVTSLPLGTVKHSEKLKE